MRRRDFMTLVGSTAAMLPTGLLAQENVPAIGFMSSRAPGDSSRLVNSFLRGLASLGFVAGQNVKIEYRWAEGEYEHLAAIARSLVDQNVALIVAVGGAASASAAKSAAGSIPVVFSIGPDPVKMGLVQSFNRPGGNVTGMSLLTTALDAKRLELVHELVPTARLIGALVNPNNPSAQDQMHEIEQAAAKLHQQVRILQARNEAELNAAFTEVITSKIEAVLIAADPFFDTARNEIVRFAAQQKIPALYQFREYVAAGGLASYGINVEDAYYQVGAYAARILKGSAPKDLPVLQPTKFQLVLNLKTARALGLTLPATLLARADEVIE